VTDAPVVLVFCAEPARSAAIWGAKGEQLLCIQDTTVACAYAQLAATAVGLASVWLGAVIEAETIREALRLTDDLWPIALLPLGYPAEQPSRTPRRTLEDFVQEL
jgi:nitroreductase